MSNPPFLIVGLGNPGKEYENTRHNFGFAVVDKLIEKTGAVKINTKLQAQICRIDINYHLGIANIGGTMIMKPQNFMNLSGQVTVPYVKKENIESNHIIVVHDDLDIPFGEIRVSKNASAGGHNGVQSIIDSLGTKDFTRVRVGIGRPANDRPIEDYVLARFGAEEKKALPEIIDKTILEIEKLFSK